MIEKIEFTDDNTQPEGVEVDCPDCGSDAIHNDSGIFCPDCGQNYN